MKSFVKGAQIILITILCFSLSLLFVACNKTEYKLTYTAGSGGTITGELVQMVEQGGDGSQVVAVADSGYLFAKWSDGVTTPSRIDKNVQKDISITAEFVVQSTDNGGNSTPGDNNPGTSGGENNAGESGGGSSVEGDNNPDGTESGGNQPEQTPIVMDSEFVGTWINVGYRVTSLSQPYFHYEGSSGEIDFDRRVVVSADGQLTYTEDKPLQKTTLVGNASENNQDYNFTFKKPVNDDGARWFYLAKRQGDYLYLQLTDDSFEHDDYGWDEIFAKVSDEVSSQTNADGTEKASSFLYHVVNDEIEIIKYVGVNKNIKIPSQIDGKNVTKIAKGSFVISKVESVVFPSTVRIIGTQSFIYSPDLVDVSFADDSQLWSIDSGAFAYCEKLATVELPEGLIYLYNEAFKYCRSLESVSVPESVGIFGDRVFFSCENLVSIAFDPDIQLSSIGKYACADCSKLEQVTIPNSVQRIKDFAFYGTKIKQLDFGSNSQLTTIGELAFNTCSSLKKVVLPATLQQIGNEAFAQCFELNELVFAQNGQLATIGVRAFGECYSLKNIVVPTSVTTVGHGAFSATQLKVFTEYTTRPFGWYDDQDWIVYWGSQMHKDSQGVIYAVKDDHAIVADFDDSVENVVIPSTIVGVPVTEIGDKAFYYYAGADVVLKNVVVPNSVTKIGNHAFYMCSWLKSINVPATVTSIGDYAFYFCIRLDQFDLASNSQLVSIGDYAFSSAYEIPSIVIPASVTEVGEYVFSHANTKVYCMATSKPNGWSEWWGVSNASYWYSENQPTTEGNYWHYVGDVPTVWTK